MGKMAGIKDVAERAGVSVTTVSRVLNKRGYISEEMYRRVNCAIEELNYYPNQVARNLFMQRTFIIGLLIPDVSHPFFARLTKCIECELNKQDYKMILCNTIGNPLKEKEYLAMLRQNKVDGIIVYSFAQDTSDYQKLTLPIVSIDRKLGERIPYVTSNHRLGGELAAKKFIENGCKNVLHVVGMSRGKSALMERHVAFRETLKKSGIRCSSLKIKGNEFLSRVEYDQIVKAVITASKKIDGVFAVDSVAVRVLQEALFHGISVPEKLKIIGYDGSEPSELTYPRLTTVCQDFHAISKSIVNSLVYQIDHKEGGVTEFVHNVTLIEGATTLL
ncbi:MAG: LacI family DNA-binding transcriptional regulator [Clostridium sp.]|uniref:LacI family DNA-binding transcriptional regulator n=1 Tax=Clostridium sp. TaxID=1506 RepID=UPI00290B496A|nr:LacI family DNA-binding transcriptional regulator [Clostridium sp.]MDU7336585.1 LacI family DNA-binding transcriptional regulator [Clostridium sp.]